MARMRANVKMAERFHLTDFTPDLLGRIVCGPSFDVLRILAQSSKAMRVKLQYEISKAREHLQWNNRVARQLAEKIMGKFRGPHEWTNVRVEKEAISHSTARYYVYGHARRTPDFANLAATIVPGFNEPRTITVVSRYVECQDRHGNTNLITQTNTMCFTLDTDANGNPGRSGAVVYNGNATQAYSRGVMLYMDEILFVLQ